MDEQAGPAYGRPEGVSGSSPATSRSNRKAAVALALTLVVIVLVGGIVIGEILGIHPTIVVDRHIVRVKELRWSHPTGRRQNTA